MPVYEVPFLRMKARHPISGLGYEWDEAGQVLEVPTEIARELFRASHGDIYEAVEEPEQVVEAEAVNPLASPVTQASSPRDDLSHALDVSSVITRKPKTK